MRLRAPKSRMAVKTIGIKNRERETIFFHNFSLKQGKKVSPILDPKSVFASVKNGDVVPNIRYFSMLLFPASDHVPAWSARRVRGRADTSKRAEC